MFDEYDTIAAELLGEELGLLLPPESAKNIGGLSDQHESELCAVVCNNTTGMTAERWAELSMEQRLPWLRHSAAAIWSEAKSPAEWRKELGRISESTLRRHAKEGRLIVDKISTKLWRIRKDSLRNYKGDE